ncbi:uncharacterized protein F4812DRAFT_418879 [Daldinia caldariorum]|uniref:uncharacterized protein n=1 Tax=Daldinia caldariorum TaxID=326644 RepID=UPI00200778D5|nr:uncharacterized protein F4812DRAFT_418879 [Daldinia caldariorum]KAI1470755.1 hypothetical protein F4812DRAFT_418879 [Daldinia caldariorum]
MVGPRGARLPVGSAPWILEERSSALQIAQSEVEEFSFSARNDFDWLNEHMAEIFSENQISVAEIFKTPGKLRGKTPRTIRKLNTGEARVPLSNIFSSTPKGAPNPFVMPSVNRNNTPRIEIAADPQPSPPKANAPESPLKHVAPPKHASFTKQASAVDSGYHGSQSQDAMDVDYDAIEDEATRPFSSEGNKQDDMAFDTSPNHREHTSSVPHSPEPTVGTNAADLDTQYLTANAPTGTSSDKIEGPPESTTPAGSPLRSPSLLKSSSTKRPAAPGMFGADVEDDVQDDVVEGDAMETVPEEDASRSSSESSSPIRPIVRKSSLNFASLPAREPITHKSIGNRVSRTSHLDQNRTSYYNRHTGGKSLGRAKHDLTDDENDDIDTDDDPLTQEPQLQPVPDNAATHNKTYTQRLQDQISKLGQAQTQTSRTSKSIPDPSVAQSTNAAVTISQSSTHSKPLPSPKKTTTPGAFPDDDDDDDWIGPLGSPENASDFRSPRPGLAKSYTADVMEGVSGKDTVSGSDFVVAKTHQAQNKSPERPAIEERATNTFSHHKSVSVPVLPLQEAPGTNGDGLTKTASASNPTLATVPEIDRPTTPTKSPSRSLKDSPLKQVKNKLSSILKGSKGLLASSAAISAEGKTSLLSPSSTKLGLQIFPSTDTLASPKGKDVQPLYPDLSRLALDAQTLERVGSPMRSESRRTRASIEREKAEEKRKEKEAKEARLMAEQMDKLEKAREKEREKARVFTQEQDRVIAMEKQVASQKEQEKKTITQTPGNSSKSARPSPRKTKIQPAAEEKMATSSSSDEKQGDDVDMVDVPNPMPPPSAPRSIAPPSATKGREIKRPVRPAKEQVTKQKQAPTVIRVNMGSQHSQYHPSNSTLSSSLHETLSQSQGKNKSNQLPLHKQSLQSLKSSTSSSGRPKALEAAARRKEQEEREAQRKRDAKAELERKRAAMQEEERRQEQQRRADAERQKEEERKQAEAKKNAQRQAMIEKAKQTRAPPPAARSQPNGPPDYSRAEAAIPRPPSRLASNLQRSQEDVGRPVNAVLSNATKAGGKRPLQQDYKDENSRQAPSRTTTGYQSKEPKRMRMTDEFDDDFEVEKQPSLKGAPVRPSGGYKKDLPTKSMFSSGYTNVPLNNRDLFKTTVTNQHNTQVKTAHPLDMAQVSKAPIPFAANPNATGSSYKTPARPQGVMAAKSAAKSATRSSPRFQNGELIDLPEINTDDEDDDYDDGAKDMIASWADSPNLRQALVEQESKDPFQVFGAPGPLNMEEVFAKSKDRFHKFRARTSSANWSGSDRLTEEDIRKDLAARDKIRRDGGWSYEMSRDMV